MNRTLKVGVDLLPLSPNGANRRVNPAISEIISWNFEERRMQVHFAFFCNSTRQDELGNLYENDDSTESQYILDRIDPIRTKIFQFLFEQRGFKTITTYTLNGSKFHYDLRTSKHWRSFNNILTRWFGLDEGYSI